MGLESAVNSNPLQTSPLAKGEEPDPYANPLPERRERNRIAKNLPIFSLFLLTIPLRFRPE